MKQITNKQVIVLVVGWSIASFIMGLGIGLYS